CSPSRTTAPETKLTAGLVMEPGREQVEEDWGKRRSAPLLSSVSSNLPARRARLSGRSQHQRWNNPRPSKKAQKASPPSQDLPNMPSAASGQTVSAYGEMSRLASEIEQRVRDFKIGNSDENDRH